MSIWTVTAHIQRGTEVFDCVPTVRLSVTKRASKKRACGMQILVDRLITFNISRTLGMSRVSSLGIAS